MDQSADEPGLLLGGFVFSTDPAMAEIYAAAGFDFIIIDMEHALNDLHATVAHLRAARGAGINAVARVGAANLANIQRLLDAGCEGVFLPHLGMPGTETNEALRALKYHPDGVRPTCTGVSAASLTILQISAASSQRQAAMCFPSAWWKTPHA